MIRWLPRDEALDAHPSLGAHIASLQRVMGGSRLDDAQTLAERAEAESWLSRHADSPAASAAREAARPRFVRGALCRPAPVPSIQDAPDALAAALTAWLSRHDLPHLLCAPLWRGCWLPHPNAYPPAADARAWLDAQLQRAPAHAEVIALIPPGDPLRAWCRAWFWLVRCCPDLPELYAAAPGDPTIWTLCQHGIWHAEIFCISTASTTPRQDTLSAPDWSEIASCGAWWDDDTPHMEGRRLVLDPEATS